MPVDDGNACTDDVCDNGVPLSTPVAAGSPCSMGGTECDGLGTCFAPACTGTLGFPGVPTPSVGVAPVSVVTADLNGDGKLDLALTNTQSSTVSVLRNQGNGTFAPAVNYGESNFAGAITAADLNGDGRIDLFVPGGALLNTGCLP